MQKFISCDWGTSSFKLGVIDGSSLKILARITTNEGIANTYKLWQQSGTGDEGKLFFYQSVISDKIKDLEKQLDTSLEGIEIVISGMASSSIGMMELPYQDLPFSIDGSDLLIRRIAATINFNYHAVLVSGVRSSSDVMRGEETQLIGCAIRSDEERLFILPGTHSKHVSVKQQKAFSFQTFMTGEFLDLFSTKSILANSIENQGHFDLMALEAGVMKGLRSNFLQECFAIRSNELLGKISKESNYDYLKGLLLGTELKELSGDKRPITIVGTELMNRDYQAALKILQLNRIRVEDSKRATINGHYKILRLLNKYS